FNRYGSFSVQLHFTIGRSQKVYKLDGFFQKTFSVIHYNISGAVQPDTARRGYARTLAALL
ncbi:MAG: hypothetical protein LUE91_03665, partial [Oscillospiraceae bacterium]|nr:hypothetical protein [Oscillospiraceae bacterium]